MKSLFYNFFSKLNVQTFSGTLGVTIFGVLMMFGEGIHSENYVKNNQVAKHKDLTGVWIVNYTPVFTFSPYFCIVNTRIQSNQIKDTYLNGKDASGKLAFIQKANKLISPPVKSSAPDSPNAITYSSGGVTGNQVIFNKYNVYQDIVYGVLTYTGTISADGNKIAGTVVCHHSIGSQTVQGNFQWTRASGQPLHFINLLALFYDFPSFP